AKIGKSEGEFLPRVLADGNHTVRHLPTLGSKAELAFRTPRRCRDLSARVKCREVLECGAPWAYAVRVNWFPGGKKSGPKMGSFGKNEVFIRGHSVREAPNNSWRIRVIRCSSLSCS